MRLVIALLISFAAPHAAAIDYSDYTDALKSEDGRKALIAYLDGFGDAVGNYEAHQVTDGRPSRFCRPQGSKLNAETLAPLITKVLNEQPQLARKGVGIPAILWIGLQRQYPCKPGVRS
jgi:hypothetical protein